jgi:hypothetical protein
MTSRAILKGDRKMKDKIELCTDQCKHCLYIEEGDFLCNVKNEMTIEDWEPKVCVCPKKKEIEK